MKIEIPFLLFEKVDKETNKLLGENNYEMKA